MKLPMKQLAILIALTTALTLPVLSATELKPRDLTPVTWFDAPQHPAVEIVQDGKARAVIYVADPKFREKVDPKKARNAMPYILKQQVDELIEVIRLSTGATLTLADQPPTADQPAIVIGDCDESRKAGIDAAAIPIEGFVIKTAANRVFLVGSTQAVPAGSDRWSPWSNDGTAWAVSDFLERFTGVRWYWPADVGGRSIVATTSLAVPPVHYSDHPVFRTRLFHPSSGWKLPTNARWFDKEPTQFAPGAIPEGITSVNMASYLPLVRSGNSWPYLVKVHEPQKLWKQWESKWSKNPELMEMFQLKKDGTRYMSMLCYSSPKTLEYLLQGCADTWDHGKPASWVTSTCVTVSPGDYPIDCQCAACKETMAKGGGSLVLGQFVKKMCEAVKQRWPDKKVIFLPYYNYQKCPKEIEFPDNLEVMVCTTGGPMALMIQPDRRKGTEANLHAWQSKIGRPMSNWDYSDRGSGWTYGPVQYPHLVRDFYQANQSYLVGTYINGGMMSDWTTSQPTLYVWMKVLWNPALDVDATLDEMCRRLYGKAAPTARELITLQDARWQTLTGGLGDQGRFSPKTFQRIWPPDVVAKMKALRDKALSELTDDPAARQRFLFWTWTFDAFVKEAEETLGK